MKSTLRTFCNMIAEADAPTSEEEAMMCLQQQDCMVAEVETAGRMSNEEHFCNGICSGHYVRCKQFCMTIVDATNFTTKVSPRQELRHAS